MARGYRVGLLSPGAMGVSVGTAAGPEHAVLWAVEGRSDRTRQRAERARLSSVDNLSDLVARVDIMLSICPPGRATDVAEAVAAEGFDGIYVDANAVSPDTARKIESTLPPSVSFVDGSLIGPPVREPGTTRLYLAGTAAGTVAGVFAGGPLAAVPLDGPPGGASAVKACYAAWTKGSAALLLAIRALASAEGVEEALLGEWHLSQPHLPEQSGQHAQLNAPKAWRFVDEMHEIAATFAAVGLPDGFHVAAADVYGRLEHFKDVQDPISLPAVVASLVQELP